jgi:hypothetical protein
MRSNLCSRPMARRRTLRIIDARIVRPQVDEAGVICRHPDRGVEPGPALCFHLALETGADIERTAAGSKPTPISEKRGSISAS